MSSLRHVLIALCYAAVAVATALALPQLAPGVSGPSAILVGGMLFVGFALLHEVFARQEHEGRFAEELFDLRLAHGEVTRELSAARGEMSRLCQTLSEAKGHGISDAAYDALAAEVRVLQELVERVSDDKPAPAAAATPRRDPADVAALPVAYGLDDATILNVVRDGLRADRIDLYLQPIVSLPQRQRRYYETFTRIRDGEGKVVVPDQYITIAEREGLVTAIDNMLLFRCVQLVRKTQRNNKRMGFFCNISAATLADRAFFRDFVDFMGRNAELAPDMIFEFPQAVIVGRDPELDRCLARLGEMGFRFSMDQVQGFRFDYDYLAAARFKFVKIDAQTLVAQIKDPSVHGALRNMKRALRSAGISLVVEKVESEPVLLDLLDFQVDFGQGYLFGEPRLSRV
jgi:cyclic-di-GMP phosphodiesterase TipF (flagellum assembly factor)